MSEWERGYGAGFAAGMDAQRTQLEGGDSSKVLDYMRGKTVESALFPRKRKRKLSAWQKYVKVNSKKPRFKFKSGSKRGRVNFKALGVAFRKTPAGRKKRR